MLGAFYRIQFAKNEDLKFTGTFTANGISGDPINLSTYTPYMSIVDTDGNEVLDCDTFITIGGDQNNVITVLIPSSEFSSIDAGTYYYDLLVTDGTLTQRLLYGEVIIYEGYTVI